MVIGQDCDASGQPMFPPVGLAANRLDKIQQELLAAGQLIQPPIEEAVVNAVYHRSYEEREPIEVHVSRQDLATGAPAGAATDRASHRSSHRRGGEAVGDSRTG